MLRHRAAVARRSTWWWIVAVRLQNRLRSRQSRADNLGRRIMTHMRTLRRATALGLVAALTFGTVGALPVAAKDKSTNAMLQVPVVGTTSNGGTFQGTATITDFAVDGHHVVATGTITGIINGTQSIVSTFSAPIAPPSATATQAAAAATAAATCQILNLVLGPINLNILGLVVNIPNPIVLNITAVPGAGNLLGNLLCSVVNLLNGGGALQQIADLLNQILGVLNGL
jgi:hypothetical protein